jgi:hypothetical protein
MGNSPTGIIAFGIKVEEDAPWLADLFENEALLPKELEIVHYGYESCEGSTFIALKRAVQYSRWGEAAAIKPSIRWELSSPSKIVLKEEFQIAISKIPNYPLEETSNSNPKWMLLSSYG